MADIFAAKVVSLYNGSETNPRVGFPNTYPPRFSVADTETASTVAPSATQAKWNTNSLRFAGGAADYVYSAALANNYTEAEDKNSLTVEAWVRPDATSGAQALFSVQRISTSAGPGTDANAWSVIMTGTSLALQQHNVNAASLPAGTLAAGAWAHVAWTVTAGNTHRLFVNGALVLSYAGQGTSDQAKLYGTTSLGTSTPVLTAVFGRATTTSTYPTVGLFTGYMDDLRVTHGVRYPAAFTAPAAAFDLTPAASAQGVGAALGLAEPAALSTGQIKRQGDALAVGTTGGSVVGSRMRGGIAASAGATTTLGETGEEADPPSTATTTVFGASLSADSVADAAFGAAADYASTMVGALLRDATLSTELTMASVLSIAMELEGSITAVLAILATLPQQTERGTAWVLNVSTGATSRYEGYSFNSFGRIGTTYIGCRSDGLYVLDGDDDAGSAIRASISFGKHDLKSPLLKRLVKAYIDASSTAKMILKVTTAQGEFTYEARDFDELLTNQRFDVGRGLEGRHFTLELFNNDGCDFTLAGAEFLASEIMNRRI